MDVLEKYREHYKFVNWDKNQNDINIGDKFKYYDEIVEATEKDDELVFINEDEKEINIKGWFICKELDNAYIEGIQFKELEKVEG